MRVVWVSVLCGVGMKIEECGVVDKLYDDLLRVWGRWRTSNGFRQSQGCTCLDILDDAEAQHNCCSRYHRRAIYVKSA